MVFLQSRDFLQGDSNPGDPRSALQRESSKEGRSSHLPSPRLPIDSSVSSSAEHHLQRSEIAQLAEMRSDDPFDPEPDEQLLALSQGAKPPPEGFTQSWSRFLARSFRSPNAPLERSSLSTPLASGEMSEAQEPPMEEKREPRWLQESRPRAHDEIYNPSGALTRDATKDGHQGDFGREQTMNYGHKKSIFEQDFTFTQAQSEPQGANLKQPYLQEHLAASSSLEEDEEDEVMGQLEIEEPETVIGEGVALKGQLTFKRYLCINGEFEGDLKSSGKVKVGKTGVVRSNLTLYSAVIEGKVVGDLVIEDLLELRGSAQVYGNIRARYLRVDDGVTINGHLQIMPQGQVRASESSLFGSQAQENSEEEID